MEYAPEPAAEQLIQLSDELVPGRKITFCHRIFGGLGCTMDVLSTRSGSDQELKLVLRRRGANSQDNNISAARNELIVLGALGAAGIPVPEPIWLDENGIFAEPATVIGYIHGKPLITPDDPIDYTSQLARMLARIHDFSPPENIAANLRNYNRTESTFLDSLHPPASVAAHPLGVRLWDAQRSELLRIELDESVFLHGDYWPGNTLWQDQELAAVVDFEEIGLGDPALDVATAIVNYRYESWGDAASNFVSVYQGETGRKLESLRFWTFKELRRPMPDIARWLPSMQEIGSNPGITADELREVHSRLILEELG